MNARARHERASALFLALRALPEGARQDLLDRECAGDDALRAEVLSLLRHDLPDPAPAPGQPADDGEATIGPYRVVRRVGQGASGYVLLADQEEPVRRRVAIKIVPFAAVSPEAGARFEFERRALERAEHPNIARILDAGATREGLPYLVMEYVEGETITAYCRERALSVRERIALILDVADAVQHAHQRGVIHRDLKPGNILVSDTGGRASPRVLDFGIAKPTPSPGADEQSLTIDALGTPAYMAPEQTGGISGGVSGGAGSVDTRADVYALGAVLYELVCARPPVDTAVDIGEALRRIREVPPPPVRKARAGAPLDAVGRPDGVSLVDLERVLAKALEKSPARRYPTVAALADDLRRLQGAEPVAARPATIGYRAMRFAQRHRASAIAAALVALATIVGVAGLAAGLLEADRQRREATLQRDAQRAINDFLTADLLAATSPDREGTDVSASDLLRRAGERVDGRLGDRPIIAAVIHHTLGDAFAQLGAYDDAERHHALALDLRTRHAGADAPDTVRSEASLASLLARRQRLDEAAPALERALARAERFLPPDDPTLYAILNDLGATYDWMDRGEDAVNALERALEGRRRLLGDRDPLVLTTVSNLAQAYERLGQIDRTLDLMRSALDIALSLDDAPRMTILGLQNNIGATLQDQGRHEEAAPYLRDAAAGAASLLGEQHPATLTISANLAALEARLGDFDRALALYARVLDAQRESVGPDAHDTMSTRFGVCNTLRLAGRTDEAIGCFDAFVPDAARALGDSHWLTAQARVGLAITLRDAGRLAEALPHARRGERDLHAALGPDHPRAAAALDLVRELEAASPDVAGTNLPAR